MARTRCSRTRSAPSAFARPRPPARPRPDGRERRADLAAAARGLEHAATTARWNVFYGEGRDSTTNGAASHTRASSTSTTAATAPATQQGYSAVHHLDPRPRLDHRSATRSSSSFSTRVTDDELDAFGGRDEVDAMLLRAATRLVRLLHRQHRHGRCPVLGHRRARPRTRCRAGATRPADPFNQHEPVDSSAAAIAAQGLPRLGR